MVSVTTSLRHKFTVSSATVTVDVDTRLNIKKRKERVVFRTVSNQNNINLAYVISQNTTPSNNLFVSDRSTSVTQNRLPSTLSYVTFTGSQFTVNTTGFVVTDTFTTETPTQPSEPLFYYHKLRYYNDDLDDFSSMTLLSLEFVDYLFTEKEVTEYYSETSTGKIYNNLENTFNDQTYDFDVTYVKYSVKNGTSISTYHELINNSPVYEEASFDDIDDWGNIISGHKVYIVDTLPGGSTYSITMPTSDDYAYKELETSRIRVLGPNAIDTSAPWYVRITNGQFLTSLQRSLTESYSHKYYLPEYDTQLFNPYPPYKNHTEQKATWLSDNLIKVPTNIVGDYATALFTEIIVKDSSDTVVYAYTNNPAKEGDYYNSDILWDTDGILSVDDNGGFIEVVDKMLDSYEILVSYSSEEDDYEVTDIDFNPISNSEILDYRIAFYVAPEYYATGEIEKSLYYLKVDSLGKIAYASQAEDGSTLLPSTQRLLIEDFYSDGTPRHDFYYDVESTASGLRATYSGNFSSYIDELSFIDKYTTESVMSYESYMVNSGLYDGLVGSGELLENMSNNPKFLVLADVYVGEAAAPENATVMDVRVRGGGVKEDYEVDVFDEQPEAMWYWDIAQKLPYPSNTAFMVEVPKTLLTEYGGDYEYDQLRTTIERHIQFGAYPIIRTYGIDPVLTSGVGWSGYIELGWPSYGSDKTYNVYYSNLENTGFAAHNSSPIADVIAGNTYTITGLSLLKDYYVYIGAIDTDDYEFYGPKYKITTTAT